MTWYFYVNDPCNDRVDITWYPFEDIDVLIDQCGYDPTEGSLYTPVTFAGLDEGGTYSFTI